MSNLLKFSGQSGITAGAVITDRATDNVWDGTNLVTYVDGNFTSYLISIPEIGHGIYSVAVPTQLPAGRYLVVYYDEQSVEVIFQAQIDWDGGDIAAEGSTGPLADVNICNMALRHLGISSVLANLQTDTGVNADACREFYSVNRDSVLEDFPYPFGVMTVALGLVASKPTVEWNYSYRYPSSCVMLKRIFSCNTPFTSYYRNVSREDSVSSRIPYRIVRDAVGQLIYTDMINATMEYIFRETDVNRYPKKLIEAMAARLAFFIAPSVSKGDPFKLGVRAMTTYQSLIGKAQANQANQEIPDYPVESEFIRARS